MKDSTERAFWIGLAVVGAVVITANVISLRRPANIRSSVTLSASLPGSNASPPAVVFGVPSQTDLDLLAAARADIQDGIAFANSHYSEAQLSDVYKFLIRELCKDRLEAMLQILPLLASEDRASAVGPVAGYWADHDIAKFRAFVDAQPYEALKTDLNVCLAVIFAQRGRFEESFAILDVLPQSSKRTFAMANIVSLYAERDPQSAFARAANLESLDEKEAVCGCLLSTLSHAKKDVKTLEALRAIAPRRLSLRIQQEIDKASEK